MPSNAKDRAGMVGRIEFSAAAGILWSILMASLLCVIGATVSTLQAAQVIRATGEAGLEAHRTYAEACEEARARALLTAVREVAGERLTATSTVEMGTLLAQCIRVFATGHILSTSPPQWSIEWTPRAELPPDIRVKATLDVEVKEETSPSDESFKVRVALNNATFRSKERAILTVEVSQPAYLSVFNQTADGEVTLIFPNRFRSANRVEANRPLQIPAREDLFDLLVNVPEGRPRAVESFVVIATKTNIPFWPERKNTTTFLASSAAQGVADLSSWLAGIDAGLRTADVISYTVVEK